MVDYLSFLMGKGSIATKQTQNLATTQGGRGWLVVLFFLLSHLACGDSVTGSRHIVETDSGELLIGEVLPKSTDSILYIRSGLLGEISLPRSRVVRLEARLPSALPGADKNTEAVKKIPNVPTAKSPQKSEVSEKPKAPQSASSKLSEKDKKPPLLDESPPELGLSDYLLGLRAPDSWSGDARVGINVSTGDSQWTQTYLRGKLEVRPKGKSRLYRFSGSYTYQENERSNGDKYRSQDKYDLSLLFRHNFKNNWFIQNTSQLRVDQKKGIDRDLSNLVGIGYSFRPLKNVEFNVGGAGGMADYNSNKASSRNGNETILSVFEEFTWKPLKRTSLVHRFNYFWNPDDDEEYNFVIKTALRVRVTDLLGFEFSHNKSYDNNTGTGNNKDDTRWLNALILFF